MDQVDHLIGESLQHLAAQDVLLIPLVVFVHQRLELLGEIHALHLVDLLEVIDRLLEQLLQQLDLRIRQLDLLDLRQVVIAEDIDLRRPVLAQLEDLLDPVALQRF